MSSGISWIDETRVAVDRASKLQQAQDDLDVLEEIEGELDDALRDLPDLHAAVRVGQGSWWSGFEAPPNLWMELHSAQKDLGRRQLRSFIHHLKAYRTRLRESLQAAWREQIAARAGDAGELRELVRVLAGAAGLVDVASSLDEALGRLARLEKRLPDHQAVQALDEAVNLLDDLERRLPAAVRAFVSAAARGGASLDLFDVEVRTWLVEKGAANNFRIVPGRPQEVRHG